MEEATYLRIKLNLPQIKLGLSDKKPAKRVLRQEFDDETQKVRVGVVVRDEFVLDVDGEDVAEHALARVAPGPDGELDDGDPRVVDVVVVLSEDVLQPLLGDGPLARARRGGSVVVVGHFVQAAGAMWCLGGGLGECGARAPAETILRVLDPQRRPHSLGRGDGVCSLAQSIAASQDRLPRVFARFFFFFADTCAIYGMDLRDCSLPIWQNF